MQKHAIMLWRDDQIIGAYELFNAKAIEARNAFEKQLSEATLLDSAWNPSGFADRRIDTLLSDLLRAPLRDFFRTAAAELVAVDVRLSDLGSVLADEQKLELPEKQEPFEAAPAEAGQDQPKSQRGEERWLKRVTGVVSKGASSAAAFASESADWFVQDKVGLRNRLRHAAAARIAGTWMGDLGEPAPVLAQVIRAIEVAANEARIKLS